MAYNLGSRTQLSRPVDLHDLPRWYSLEVEQIEPEAVRRVAICVGANWQDFVIFSELAVLLWKGCDRIKPAGNQQKYHAYPIEIKLAAKRLGFTLDGRPNGPARAAFDFAGGVRPKRTGSTNDWTAHHLYSGKFPYAERVNTTHAVKSGNHFTQSAGVVTTHPIADAMCDEFPCFTWFLRAISFQKFGYDPDGVFTTEHDDLGFEKGKHCLVFWEKKRRRFDTGSAQ